MSDPARRSVWTIVAGLVLLPFLYAASIGPASFLLAKRVMAPQTFRSIYGPIDSLPKPVTAALKRYANWCFDLTPK